MTLGRSAAGPTGSRLLACLITVLVLCCPTLVRAQSDLFEMPTGTVAFFAMDPSAFGVSESATPQQQLVEGAIRAALSSGLIADKDAADILGGLLAASVVGSAPHKLCILEFKADSLPGDEQWGVTNLAAVLEVRTSRDHRSLIRNLQAILVGDGEQLDGTQSEIQLPGGLTGMSFTRDGWPTWRRISWVSTADAFFIGLGKDALTRYLEDLAPDTNPKQWKSHRFEVERHHATRGEPVLELYLDINKIRHGFADSFAHGRLGDLFGAWGLENARSFMLHARRIPSDEVQMLGVRNRTYEGPPLIAVDATWSSRADLPTEIGHRPIAIADWPARDVRIAPPPGSYAIVAEMDWRYVEDLITKSHRESRKPSDRLEIDTERGAWNRTHAKMLDRLMRSLDKWLILSDVPKPIAPVPGFTTAFIELKPALNKDRFERDLKALLASVGDRVVFDEKNETWSFRILDTASDPSGIFRALAWGLAGSSRHGVIVGGWGAHVVETNRKRLGRE